MILLKQRPAGAGVHLHVEPGHRRMSSTDTLISVIDGVCQQDPERWRQFDAIYRPMLFAYLRKQGLKDSDVSDVVQDIFVKLLGKIHTYKREKSGFRAWLFSWRTTRSSTRPGTGQPEEGHGRVGGRRARGDRLGQREDGAGLDQDSSREDPGPRAADSPEAQLSSRAWICFEQRLLRDRPAAEIAKELGIEPNLVYVNACRVMKLVRSVCEEFDEDHEPCLRV